MSPRKASNPLQDMNSLVVVDALTRECGVCKAQPGQVCTYSGTTRSLRGKRVHVYRTKSAPKGAPYSHYTDEQLAEEPLLYLASGVAVRPCHVEVWRSRLSAPNAQGCILWSASLDSNGYGQFRIHPTMVKAHQIGWVLKNGPIPDGCELDHTCRKPACCNPNHLEPVSRAENIRRIAERSTHCRSGNHRWDEQDPYMVDGGRRCRLCMQEHQEKRNRERRERRAAERATRGMDKPRKKVA